MRIFISHNHEEAPLAAAIKAESARVRLEYNWRIGCKIPNLVVSKNSSANVLGLIAWSEHAAKPRSLSFSSGSPGRMGEPTATACYRVSAGRESSAARATVRQADSLYRRSTSS